MAVTLMPVAAPAPIAAGTSGTLGLTSSPAGAQAQAQLGAYDPSKYSAAQAQQIAFYQGANGGQAAIGSYLGAAGIATTKQQLDAKNAEIAKLQSFAGTSQANPAALAKAKAEAQQLNATLTGSYLAVGGGKVNSPSGQKVLDLLQKRDPSFQAFVQSIGGDVDYSVFTGDDKAAKGLLDQYAQFQQKQVADAQQAQVLADQNAAIAQAGQLAGDQLAGVVKDAQAAKAQIDAPLANFDMQVAQAVNGIRTQAGVASRYAGLDDAQAAAGNQTANVQAQAVGDRAALQKDAMAASDQYLAQVFENASKYQFDASNLSTEGRLQVANQALDRLDTVIKNDMATADAETQNQLANLQNLIQEYKNAKDNDQIKKSLFQKIVKIAAGAAMAGGGAALAATGVGAPVGAGLIAGGAGIAGSAV